MADELADEDLVDYVEEGEEDDERQSGGAQAGGDGVEAEPTPRKMRKRAVPMPMIAVSEETEEALQEAAKSVRMVLVLTSGGGGSFAGPGQADAAHHRRTRMSLIAALTGDPSVQQPVVSWRPRREPTKEAFRCYAYTTTPESAAASLSGGRWRSRPLTKSTIFLAGGDTVDDAVQGEFGYEEEFLRLPSVAAHEFVDPAGENGVLLHGELRGVDSSWLVGKAPAVLGWSTVCGLQAWLPEALCATAEEELESTGWEISSVLAEPIVEDIVTNGEVMTSTHGVRVAMAARWLGSDAADKGSLIVPAMLPVPAKCGAVDVGGGGKVLMPLDEEGRVTQAPENWKVREQGGGGFEWKPAEGVLSADGRSIRQPLCVTEAETGNEYFVLGGWDKLGTAASAGIKVDPSIEPVLVRLEGFSGGGKGKGKGSAKAAARAEKKKEELPRLNSEQRSMSAEFRRVLQGWLDQQHGEGVRAACSALCDRATLRLYTGRGGRAEKVQALQAFRSTYWMQPQGHADGTLKIANALDEIRCPGSRCERDPCHRIAVHGARVRAHYRAEREEWGLDVGSPGLGGGARGIGASSKPKRSGGGSGGRGAARGGGGAPSAAAARASSGKGAGSAGGGNGKGQGVSGAAAPSAVAASPGASGGMQAPPPQQQQRGPPVVASVVQPVAAVSRQPAQQVPRQPAQQASQHGHELAAAQGAWEEPGPLASQAGAVAPSMGARGGMPPPPVPARAVASASGGMQPALSPSQQQGAGAQGGMQPPSSQQGACCAGTSAADGGFSGSRPTSPSKRSHEAVEAGEEAAGMQH